MGATKSYPKRTDGADVECGVSMDQREIERRIQAVEAHVSMLPYFLEQLQETPDGGGTMLDNALVIYGSPIGNPNQLHTLGLDDLDCFGDSEGTFSWE